MGFKPKTTSSKSRELIPAGTHECYCYSVVDLGTQPQAPWKGEERSPIAKILIFFEFTEILREFEGEQKPCVKSVKYTNSFGEKANLYKLIKGWIGDVENFEFDQIIGKPASVTITHETGSDGKIYDNITAVAPMSPKLIKQMPAQYNESILYSIEDDGFESLKYINLYEWVRKIIEESEEFKSASSLGGSSAIDDDSDIPF